jgi:hypothetical protein
MWRQKNRKGKNEDCSLPLENPYSSKENKWVKISLSYKISIVKRVMCKYWGTTMFYIGSDILPKLWKDG